MILGNAFKIPSAQEIENFIKVANLLRLPRVCFFLSSKFSSLFSSFLLFLFPSRSRRGQKNRQHTHQQNKTLLYIDQCNAIRDSNERNQFSWRWSLLKWYFPVKMLTKMLMMFADKQTQNASNFSCVCCVQLQHCC